MEGKWKHFTPATRGRKKAQKTQDAKDEEGEDEEEEEEEEEEEAVEEKGEGKEEEADREKSKEPARPPKHKEGTFSRAVLQKNLVFDENPSCFFLQSHQIQQRLSEIRTYFVNSLRKFPFQRFTPLVGEVLGADYVGVEDSGINQLFAPPKRGRKPGSTATHKMPRLDASVPSFHSAKPEKIRDILFQCRDFKDKELYVFVEWEDLDLDRCSWVPLSSLPPATKQWWELQCESRWPLLDLNTESPLLRVTGGPVTMNFDES